MSYPTVIRWPKNRSRTFLRKLGRPDNSKTLFLLQGPVGPFFKHLSRAASAAGFNPVKINFNGADWFFSRKVPRINFTGDPDTWAAWFEHLTDFCKPAGIVVMGDVRPLHRAAIEIARARNIPVFCFEEGYIRPDFVTLEEGGVNAFSPVRSFINDLARREEFLATAPVVSGEHKVFGGNPFLNMAGFAILYFWAMSLGRPFYRKYRHHRQRPLVTEFFLWTRALTLKISRFWGNRKTNRHLIEKFDKRFFVVALQVSDDVQLTVHGRGWSNERTISLTIASFAQFADPADRLVIKGHPQDRGHTLHRSYVRRVAEIAGCEGRVDYVDDGSIGHLLSHSKGLLTINSTAGVSALFHGVPLMAFGDGLYSDPDLVTFADSAEALDRFWCEARPADPTLVAAFLGHIRHGSLVNGSFYQPSARRFTAQKAMEKIAARLNGNASRIAPAAEAEPATIAVLRPDTDSAASGTIPAQAAVRQQGRNKTDTFAQQNRVYRPAGAETSAKMVPRRELERGIQIVFPSQGWPVWPAASTGAAIAAADNCAKRHGAKGTA